MRDSSRCSSSWSKISSVGSSWLTVGCTVSKMDLESVKPSRAIFLGGAASRPDHGIRFCYPKVAGSTQKATLLNVIAFEHHFGKAAQECPRRAPSTRDRKTVGGLPPLHHKGVLCMSFLSTSQSRMHQKNLGLLPMVPLTAFLLFASLFTFCFWAPFAQEYHCPPHNACAEIGWAQKFLIKLVHHQKDACH